MTEPVRTHYEKPGKRKRILEVLSTILSFTYLKWLCKRFAYVTINNVRGLNLAKIGKGTNIHLQLAFVRVST